MKPDNLTIDLIHQAGNWPKTAKMELVTNRVLAATIETVGLRYPPGAELSIILSDDYHVRILNRQWRKIDKPTNVLSFPIDDLKPGDMPGMLLGDIVIAFETVGLEAERFDLIFANHFSHLLIHGFLHIFGYDHVNDKDADMMKALEQRCMSTLDLPDPYQKMIEDDENQPIYV